MRSSVRSWKHFGEIIPLDTSTAVCSHRPSWSEWQFWRSAWFCFGNCLGPKISLPRYFQRFMPSELIFIAGPTAVGKSEIALLLAEKIGGEIISVDSMQVYRGLDIGTAKTGGEERKRVPHHLIDVVDLTEPFDAAQFVRLASKAVAEIQSRNRV